jgi:hypothetical protein
LQYHNYIMAKKHKYILQFANPQTEEMVGELFETHSTRESKVLEQLNTATLRKYQVPLADLKQLSIHKYNG